MPLVFGAFWERDRRAELRVHRSMHDTHLRMYVEGSSKCFTLFCPLLLLVWKTLRALKVAPKPSVQLILDQSLVRVARAPCVHRVHGSARVQLDSVPVCLLAGSVRPKQALRWRPFSNAM